MNFCISVFLSNAKQLSHKSIHLVHLPGSDFAIPIQNPEPKHKTQKERNNLVHNSQEAFTPVENRVVA